MDINDFGRVAAAAVLSINDLLFKWFPNGVVSDKEFCIGSAAGEAGRSLRVRMTGDKAGCWSDFSFDGEAGGDLISLYAYIHNIGNGKACAALARELGIELTPDPNWRGPKTPGAAPATQAAHSPAPAPQAKKQRTEWEPILPVPETAGPCPVAHLVRGRPEAQWEYRDQLGRLLGVIYRFVTSDGGKEITPCVYARHPVTGACEWRWMGFRDPRPLYLHGLLRPDLPVLIVEGEKCADAAFALVGDYYDVVSWPGGGKAIAKADWQVLLGRRVILWADADAKVYKVTHALAGQIMPEAEQPGMMAMQKLAGILAASECTVSFVDIPPPGQEVDGWDIADLIAGGATADEVIGWIKNPRPSNDSTIAAPRPPASPPPPEEDIQPGVPPGEQNQGKSDIEPEVPSGEKPETKKRGRPSAKEMHEAEQPPAGDGAGSGEGAGKKKKAVVRSQSFWDAIDHLLDNFVLLYGTDTAWDEVNRLQLKVQAVRLAFGSDAVKFWLGNSARRMINAKCLVFDPTETVDLETHVNLFNGFAIEPKKGECGKIAGLLLHLCDGDAELADWITRWLAYPLQNPGAKMSTSIIMHGDEGSGKNLFFEQVIRRIYGEYAGVIGNAQIESQFNEWASKKLFFVCDEVVTRNELKQLKGKLKGMISGEEISINPKNLPERMEANHINFVFLSNELQPLALDKTDRRYLVIWTPPKQTLAYYADVAAEIHSGGIEAYYHYLLHEVDCGDMNEHTKPISTLAKKKLISLGLSAPERFYREWEKEALPLPFVCCSAMQLYAAFQRWSHLNGERYPPTQTEFGGKVERMGAGQIRRQVVKYELGSAVKQRTVYLVGEQPPDKKLSEWVEDGSTCFESFLRKYRHVYDQSEVPSTQ